MATIGSSITSTGGGGGGGTSSPTTPKIYNVPIASSDTEYSQALTASTKMYILRVRGSANLKLAYISGQSGTNYISVFKGTSKTIAPVNFTGTIYFQADQGGQTLEIEEWS